MSKRYLWVFLAVITLITSGIFLTMPSAQALDTTMFIDPSTIIGDLTPAPGSVTSWKVNVSNIGVPGLIGHEFSLAVDPQILMPKAKPITNQNFTTDASGWTPTVTVTKGTATNGYVSNDGNPSPGSGPGSYRMRANSTASQTASITFLLEQSFNWQVGNPPDGGRFISFAYKISGNNFGTLSAGAVSVGIRVIKPDGSTTQTLITTRTYTSGRSWSYNFTTPATAFADAGTYKFQLRSVMTTASNGPNNFVEIEWDDVGLILGPIGVSQGPFLTSDSRNVGKTYWTAKYFEFPSNVTLYVAESLMGIPWTDVYPVQGNGTIGQFKLWVNYGSTDLDLYNTMLTKPGLVPPYSPEPVSHTAIDGYFDNRIPGDITGNGNVNANDLNYLAQAFGTANVTADFTGPENPPSSGSYPPDGIVDIRDLRTLGKNYGRTYP